MKLASGQPAPAFTLPDERGKRVSLTSLRGGWVLLYFYPKDDTPGCTKEACALAEAFPAFEKLDAAVLGVSTDAPESHLKFMEKYGLPFTLLSDMEKKVVRLYGVWGKKTLYGRNYFGTKRMSFLIDPRGRIAKVYATVKPELHAQEVIDDLKNLKQARP